MINTVQSMPMQGVSGMQGKPPPPPPPSSEDELAEILEARLEADELELEALDAKLTEKFGAQADGIVSDSGEVDFAALSKLLVTERNDQMQAGLTERFGADAAGIVGADGQIDQEALADLFAANGESMPPPPPPPGGMGGGMSTSYGDMGQGLAAFLGEAEDSDSLINLVA